MYCEHIKISKINLLSEHANAAAFTIKYGKLTYNAAAELIDVLHMLLRAPRNIYEELFEKRNIDSHALQNLSLCGRKVVSWSDKINVTDVAKICAKRRITPNEVYFSAASSALFTFLEEFKNEVPNNLDACARYVEKEGLLGNADYSEGRLLCSTSRFVLRTLFTLWKRKLKFC